MNGRFNLPSIVILHLYHDKVLHTKYMHLLSASRIGWSKSVVDIAEADGVVREWGKPLNERRTDSAI
jgi:hypothetical protein